MSIDEFSGEEKKCQIQSAARMGNEKGFDAAERLSIQKHVKKYLVTQNAGIVDFRNCDQTRFFFTVKKGWIDFTINILGIQ